jgi:hypothetical protein
MKPALAMQNSVQARHAGATRKGTRARRDRVVQRQRLITARLDD